MSWAMCANHKINPCRDLQDEDSDEDPRFKEVINAVLSSVSSMPGRSEVKLEQLQQHRSQQDLWVVIAGHVFDISGLITGSYGKRHPGGTKILTNLLKKDIDCTASFSKFHYPSGNGVKWMRDMYIGPAERRIVNLRG